jgi:hypothetical protein
VHRGCDSSLQQEAMGGRLQEAGVFGSGRNQAQVAARRGYEKESKKGRGNIARAAFRRLFRDGLVLPASAFFARKFSERRHGLVRFAPGFDSLFEGHIRPFSRRRLGAGHRL